MPRRHQPRARAARDRRRHRSAQTAKLFHVSNLHYCEPQARLAELLCTHSFADRVFLCNSGAEANEAAIKLARRWGHANGGERFEVVTALGSFHGRTLATLTATGQEKVRVGFQPLPAGFRYVPYDDLAALDRALTDTTAALLLEPILGEGGVVVPPPDYLAGARRLCDQRGVLLMLDEIQVGMGRTGTLFAYEQSGIVPDVITLAKALGERHPDRRDARARKRSPPCFDAGLARLDLRRQRRRRARRRSRRSRS